MPRINIYEHSDTYSFQVKNLAYATVAFPITAIWGPAYDPYDEDANPDWVHFQAGYRGTTDFVNTFRGANNMLGAREKSYDYALKLLSAGYDILVKRADGLGNKASAKLQFNTGNSVAASSRITWPTGGKGDTGGARFECAIPGTFGNSLKVVLENTGKAFSPIDTDSSKRRVNAVLSVYLTSDKPEGPNSEQVTSKDVLLERKSVTYTQTIATAGSDNFVYGEDTIPFDSEYISKVVVKNLGSIATGNTTSVSMYAKPQVTILSGGSDAPDSGYIQVPAKYVGSYGNQLKVRIKVSTDDNYRKIGTVEVFDRNGYIGDNQKIVRTDQLLEIHSVAFDINAATDARPFISETIFSNLGTLIIENEEYLNFTEKVVSLLGGTDSATTADGLIPSSPAIDVQIMNILEERFGPNGNTFTRYIRDQVGNSEAGVAGKATSDKIEQIWNQQMVFKNAIAMLDELTDPLIYDWDAVFMGIADDQYIPQSWLEKPENNLPVEYEPTEAHLKLVQVASESKCGCAMIGTPFGMKRGTRNDTTGVKTGAVKFKDDLSSMVGKTLSTFGEVVGPWCKTTLPINGSNSWVTPEVAHLLLIINAQGVGGQNKWWMVPAGMLGTGIVHSPEYKIKKAYLDIIQDHDSGVCMNPLMQVPGKGFTCFGNSTLWDKPLGTYNALQNLSTRLLTNRVKQRIWDTALQILFKYNNENAYSHFYAGVSPLLDEMRAVGALTSTEVNPWGYRIVMNPDIINLDRINANTVIGKVELAVTGVIDTVDVDLFLLPPTAFSAEA